MIRRSLFLACLLLVFAVTACAPRTLEVGVPEVAPHLGEDTFMMRDGAMLPATVYEAADPQAVLIGVHGFNDYSRAFALFGPWAAEHGLTLYTYDQRGFGRAPGFGYYPPEGVLASDLREVVGLVRARHPDAKLYLLGVSMGAAVTVDAATGAEPLPVDGIVLVAPGFWGGEALNPFYRATLWTAAHTVPYLTLSGASLERWPSDNVDWLRELGRDPLMIRETRIDAIYGLVGQMDRAAERVGDLPPPVLVLYGKRDEIVPVHAVADAASRIDGATLACYPDGWHMLLRDRQRETVWADMRAWIAGEKPAYEVETLETCAIEPGERVSPLDLPAP